MVYKKYIKKGGRIYGPYYYHSRRVNGKVISEYKGGVEEKSKKIDLTKYKKYSYPVLGIFLLGLFVYVLATHSLGGNISGNAVLELGANYQSGQPLDGMLKIALKNGELIPESSNLVIDSNSQTYTYPLSEVINSSLINGNYYLSSSDINGSGDGYGFIGELEKYPTVYFKLKISPVSLESLDTIPAEETSEKIKESDTVEETVNSPESSDDSSLGENNELINSSGNSIQNISISDTNGSNNSSSETSVTESSETVENTETSDTSIIPEDSSTVTGSDVSNIEDSSDPTSDETSTTEPVPTESAPAETAQEETPTSEGSEDSSPSIGDLIANFFLLLSPTGNVISDSDTSQIVDGSVSYGDDFSLKIKKQYDVSIVPGSVRTDNTNLSISDLGMSLLSNEVIVTTDYKEVQSGFGKQYSQTGENYLFVNISKLNLDLNPGEVRLSIVYNDLELTSTTAILQSGQVANLESNNKSKNKTVQQVRPPESELKGLPSNLTTQEQAILSLQFKNQQILVNKAIESGNKIKIKYELGDYWFEGTYDASLSKEALSSQLDEDKTKWLKDIASELLRKEPLNTPLVDLIGNYSR